MWPDKFRAIGNAPQLAVTPVYIFNGHTYIDVQRVKNVGFYRFDNKTSETSMDLTLSKTITGFSQYVDEVKPDLIVIHGDRPEPLACAIVGSFKNILVAHIEGGEISGTVDEIIRHSISKLSHLHFVTNNIAKQRLIQMGEVKKNIFTIDLFKTPIDFKIAMSRVLFLTRIVKPEIILKAATIMIKDNIINITFLSTFKAENKELFVSDQL